MKDGQVDIQRHIDAERKSVLYKIESWLDTPMTILGFAWLGLLIFELIWGLTPALTFIGSAIWIIFVIDFAARLIIAPDKTDYLKTNWLTALALLVPAFRVLRVFRAFRLLRAARAARGVRLLRVLSSLNRGMRSLGASFGRRGFGYVVSLSLIVIFAGAAGMLAFENGVEGGIKTYGEALWWTSMLLTSIGSDYFPKTSEGRALCFVLALYGFGVFGYVTATLATFFVGRDAESKESEIAGAEDIRGLRDEIALLRAEIRKQNQRAT